VVVIFPEDEDEDDDEDDFFFGIVVVIFPDSELWDLFFWNISRFGIVRLIFRSYGTSEISRNCGTYFRFGIVRLIFRKYGILPNKHC
jgi:hypothetical protein